MLDHMIDVIIFFALFLAVVFGFWTGFTDAAYATAGIIATRAVKSNQAIVLSTVGSLIGMTVFGSAVAKTRAGVKSGSARGFPLSLLSLLPFYHERWEMTTAYPRTGHFARRFPLGGC